MHSVIVTICLLAVTVGFGSGSDRFCNSYSDCHVGYDFDIDSVCKCKQRVCVYLCVCVKKTRWLAILPPRLITL